MQGASDTLAEEDRVPRLATGWETQVARLSPQEGFLLSRIDGYTPWGVLRQIGGVPPEVVDRCLERWVAEGLLDVEEARPRNGSAAGACAGSADSGCAAIDPSLELPVDIQEQILAFDQKLEGASYFEILGVSREADVRAVKRAYFELSKLFHPDRYFGRRTGDFAPRLDRIFKKVAIAYELLMDPTTRSEVERSLAAAPPPPEPRVEDPSAPPRKLTKRETLDRLRRQFRIPEKILAERRFKARQFNEAARVSRHQQKWNEAASSIRLAIAFDPWTDEYKEDFAQIQAEVNQLRAAKLLEEASGAMDSSSAHKALQLLEEAMGYRPGDAEVHVQAARVACEIGDFERANEYAERACELAPDSASYMAVLARSQRGQGLRQKAKKTLEAASKLDPHDEVVGAELRRLRKSSAPATGGKR
jgi:curved DNA-binding protein CbpA